MQREQHRVGKGTGAAWGREVRATRGGHFEPSWARWQTSTSEHAVRLETPQGATASDFHSPHCCTTEPEA